MTRDDDTTPTDPPPGTGGPAQDETELSRQAAAFLAAMEAELPETMSYDPDRGVVMLCTPRGELMEFCTPFRVSAVGRRLDGSNRTRRVDFLDPEGQLRTAQIRNADLQRHPSQVVADLVDGGFELHGTLRQFAEVLKAWPTANKVWLADQPGWLDLPDGTWTYLDAQGRAYAASGAARSAVDLAGPPRPVRTSGSLAGWQETIGVPARGNPALIAAIATTLAAPLLRMAGLDTLGLNFHATTSLGKTTAHLVALSGSDDPAMLNTWSGTEAGLESLAEAANDGTLLLDEFPAKPENHVLATAYAFGNGTGKTRRGTNMGPAETVHYRLALLSTSERPLVALFANTRTEMPGGVAARLIDIPAGAWAHGLFADLHDHADGHAFSLALSAAARTHHGHVFPAFMDWLMRHEEKVEEVLPKMVAKFERQAKRRLGVADLTGLPARVVRRLGLVATAGEFGARARILPWPPREAFEALLEIAVLWKADYDRRQPPSPAVTADRLRELVDQGERFTSIAAPGPTEAPFAGWLDAACIYIDAEIFADEVAGEIGTEAAARYLQDTGYLRPGGERNSLQYRLPAKRVPLRPRVYRISRERLRQG